ncbi:uncharacterized protein SOCEGT47_066620 [Sorangium cellulosum]|uniref:DUF2029 domain-containing protein n=1 Tax=Sorangium cellulosum TaxID=56 RepID=A0A4P2QAK5_SORCE|nr:glycosyltransferase 87 family protein [Sorangium cellulosum]AUX26103.1 uncharacterized protein SOCEGT47_066620 [Sorangium cellulosum]
MRAAPRARASNELLGYLAVFTISTGAALLCVLDIVLKQPVAVDFRSFYTAFLAASRGLDVYDVEVLAAIASEMRLPEGPTFPYLYPPFLAYAFQWLARLRPEVAQAVWSSAAVVSFGVAATLAVAAIRRASRGSPGADRAPAVPAALIAHVALLAWALNLRHNLAMGQVNPLVLAFLCAALALSLSGKDALAGLALAVAAGIKITPVLLAIPWVLERRRRALAGLAAGLGALALISLPLGAAPAWLEFSRRLPRMSHGDTIPGLFNPGTTPNFSLAGFYTRLFASNIAAVKVASVITVLLLLGGALALGGRAASPSCSLRRLLPLLVTMVVASPFTYVHHVLYVFPAALFALDRATEKERRAEVGVILGLLSLATIDFPYVYERFKAPLPPLLLSVNLYVLLALYALGMRMLWREAGAAPGALAPAGGGEAHGRPARGAAAQRSSPGEERAARRPAHVER